MAGAATRTVDPPWERETRAPRVESRLERLADEILERCRGEGPANCVARCPLHVDARGYVQLIKDGRFGDALRLVRDRLPFPGTLGHICAHPCELHCKRIDQDRAVRIRDLKRFLAEWEPGEPQHVLDREVERPERVAVVGGGPSGLIAAHDLSRAGFPVTLFEREDRIGGCLVHKIPEWRLPRRVVERDLSIIGALPIEVRTGVRVGPEVTLASLREEFPAVLLLCGSEGGLELPQGRDSGLRRTIRATVSVSGPASVIDALALGRRCAESARRYLDGRDLHADREGPLPRRLLWTLEIDEAERRRRERRPDLMQPGPEPLDEAEAREEADGCLGCECRLCVEDCEFLAAHCDSPKDLARHVQGGLEDEAVLKTVYSCNVCSLCAAVCPEELDMGALLMEARRTAVRRGAAPLPQHRKAVGHFDRGVSRAFSLLMSEPGRGRSKRLFFTGCSLPATAPAHVVRVYDELRKHYRGTGVLMYCCGAPVAMLGMEEAFHHTREQILRRAESVGAEELIAACPDCAHILRPHLPELRVTTAWELLAESWQPPQNHEPTPVALHDSCTARHQPGLQAAVRRLVEAGGGRIEEADYSRERARCCGLGGMVRTVDPGLAARIARRSAGESSLPMITYCAGCRKALAGCGKEALHLLDFLLAPDWRKSLGARPPGHFASRVNRLRAKWSFKRLRPLGAG